MPVPSPQAYSTAEASNAVQRRVRRLASPWISRWRTGPKRVVREWLADLARRVARRPHEVLFFYDAADPYSHLAAQLVPRFARAYRVQLRVLLVPSPSDAHVPERKRLLGWAVCDVRDIAPFYGLKLGRWQSAPARPLQRLAQRALLAAGADAPMQLAELSSALWDGKARALKARPLAAPSAVEEALADGARVRAAHGHYAGAMFYYGGSWYWGADRLSYLTARLDWHGLRRAHAPKVRPRQPPALRQMMQRPRRAKTPSPAPARFTLDCFVSLRSPYSYVAMPDLLALARHQPLRLRPRPVLPMVMRGLPVPPDKGVYILEDAAREALTHGVPFGNVQDPVGAPVRRGMSLFPFAQSQGRGMEWLHAFCYLAWARGRYMGDDKHLRAAAQMAGLSWKDAQPHLDSRDWVKLAESNQKALFALGLWGVPSFHLTAAAGGKTLYKGWGRDRIWRIASLVAAPSGRSGKDK